MKYFLSSINENNVTEHVADGLIFGNPENKVNIADCTKPHAPDAGHSAPAGNSVELANR